VEDLGTSPPVITSWVVTPPLGVVSWTHFWTYAGPPESAITGTLSLEFLVHDDGAAPTVVHIDEVSVGATPGGPYRMYMPFAFKHF